MFLKNIYEKFIYAVCKNSSRANQRISWSIPFISGSINSDLLMWHRVGLQEAPLSHLPAMWPWTSLSTFLSLNILICEIEVVATAPPVSLQSEVGSMKRIQVWCEILRDWKEPKCLLDEGWLHHLRVTHVMRCHAAIKSHQETLKYWYGRSSSFNTR